MTRLFVVSVAAMLLVGVSVNALQAADLEIVPRYRSDPPIKPVPPVKGPPKSEKPRAPAPLKPATTIKESPPEIRRVEPKPVTPPDVLAPPPIVKASPPAPSQQTMVRRPEKAELGSNAIVRSDSIFILLALWWVVTFYPLAGTAVREGAPEVKPAHDRSWKETPSNAFVKASSTVQAPPISPVYPKEPIMEPAKKSHSTAPSRAEVPLQDGWAERAGGVRDPFSALWFRLQARSNAWALRQEKERLAGVREVMKEYTGMYGDLRAGEDAAQSYSVQRDLSNDRYDAEVKNQKDGLEEAAHKLTLNAKRRVKEQTEADHDQQALELFLPEKIEVGRARYKAKVQEHLAGAAAAEAAATESKGPARESAGSNETSEVAILHGLLQQKLQAIDEAERLGKDSQGLREQALKLKELLNLT